MREQLFIVELSDRDIRAIAQGLHVLLLDDPELRVSSDALTRLRQQTSTIFKDPRSHNVYPTLTAPSNAVSLDSVCYVPMT